MSDWTKDQINERNGMRDPDGNSGQIKRDETEPSPILSAPLHDAAPLGKLRGRPV